MKLKFYPIYMLIFFASILHIKSQAQTHDSTKPVSLDSADDTIQSIPSVKAACKTLNHKLLINLALVYYFQNCSLHLITDPSLINILILHQKKTPLKMSPKVYASLPLGSNYTYENYYAEFPQKYKKNSLSACKKYNKNIISENNSTFYYIENCKKRKFENYKAVQQYNTKNNPIHSITNYELSLFSDGKEIRYKRSTKDIKAITETNLQKNLPKKSILCKKIDHKVMAFYTSFFYVEKCILFPIKHLSVAVQMEVEKRGGIQDLSIEQMLGLEEGKEISEKELLKKMR